MHALHARPHASGRSACRWPTTARHTAAPPLAPFMYVCVDVCATYQSHQSAVPFRMLSYVCQALVTLCAQHARAASASDLFTLAPSLACLNPPGSMHAGGAASATVHGAGATVHGAGEGVVVATGRGTVPPPSGPILDILKRSEKWHHLKEALCTMRNTAVSNNWRNTLSAHTTSPPGKCKETGNLNMRLHRLDVVFSR